MTAPSELLTTRNGEAVALEKIPRHDLAAFQRIASGAVEGGQRVASFFGYDAGELGGIDLLMVLANDEDGQLNILSTSIEGNSFPSMTPDCNQVHLFEREIAEQFGVRPEGHPWLKPVRYQASWRPGRDAWNRPGNQPIVPGSGDFYRVEGDEIHEVAVGPVHAGVIEPGHFRFQCHGEHVFHLEIALGYQHRGVEKALVEQPAKRALHYAENLCGDTAIGHSTAYCQVVEALSGCRKTVRAQALRGIALEFERLANHIGDLGALSGDAGFLPTASYCGRIRGDFLNMTAVLCGNRFGRGMLRPGGAGYDLDDAGIEDLLTRLEAGEKDAASAIELLFDTPSVLARFEGIGLLPADVCRELGIVGPAARAAGLERDVRHDHPSGIYRFAQLPLPTWNSGDVFGRAFVRWLEIKHSITFIRDQLHALPAGDVRAVTGPLKPGHLAVSLIEGWRGELCHVALTDAQGKFRRYKVTDPSFHNWAGLAYALRDQQISDFPLCNKSFNLSYCGHDL
ncbi:hydrogenase large subunit [Pontiella sulfatireligans]|uniref:Formate hydrogenlyase subunit 5 n=1 Tax=Pontiella sulfatireligans TaxID=2750658 RepID=A0A6C2UK53_9BACT|nr:NADH-quinone oxidoreductase subunit C [Pontiella sulfatireligans]VGO20610.1 Formate hydrogenlyase subunit 5 [Pontiella sulfatireligans]